MITPNDGECHLSTGGEYTHSDKLDYPSISQINQKVKQNSINVIFAVTSQQAGVYQTLSKHVEGSTSGILSEDSSNVVDLVREQYDVSKMNSPRWPFFLILIFEKFFFNPCRKFPLQLR